MPKVSATLPFARFALQSIDPSTGKRFISPGNLSSFGVADGKNPCFRLLTDEMSDPVKDGFPEFFKMGFSRVGRMRLQFMMLHPFISSLTLARDVSLLGTDLFRDQPGDVFFSSLSHESVEMNIVLMLERSAGNWEVHQVTDVIQDFQVAEDGDICVISDGHADRFDPKFLVQALITDKKRKALRSHMVDSGIIVSDRALLTRYAYQGKTKLISVYEPGRMTVYDSVAHGVVKVKDSPSFIFMSQDGTHEMRRLELADKVRRVRTNAPQTATVVSDRTASPPT